MDTNRFEVYGTYGIMRVDIGTGKVLSYEPQKPDEPEYADIARIDIPAYVTAYGLRINSGDHVCIMDLGFWTHEGKYFDPGVPTEHPDDGKSVWPQPDAIRCSLRI